MINMFALLNYHPRGQRGASEPKTLTIDQHLAPGPERDVQAVIFVLPPIRAHPVISAVFIRKLDR